MTGLAILALLIYTFGAYAYGAVLWLSLQDYGRRGWAAQRRDQPTDAEKVGAAMMLVGFVWFLVNLTDAILRLGPPASLLLAAGLLLWLPFFIRRSSCTSPSRRWSAAMPTAATR